MDFSAALRQLKDGGKVARLGWNGKDMWLCYADAGTFSLDGEVQGDLIEFIVMKTAQGDFVPWLPSQSDMLAVDWEIVA